MSYSSDKKHKLIFENWRKFTKKQLLTEKEISGFDPAQFPNPLPGDASKSYMSKGWDDQPDDEKIDTNKEDDKVDANESASVPASSLMPSQNAVFLGKALGMSMVPKLSQGGQLGGVISGDNHILDGHHRWAATILRTGGDVDIIGTKVDLPINQLIPVLRAAGDAYGNPRKGEPQGGDLNVFSKSATDPNVIKQMIEQGKYMDPEFYDREKLQAHVESIGGIDAIVKGVMMMQKLGAKAYGGSGVKNAPSRDQMPVLEPKKGNVKNVAKRLKKGTIDVAPPYAPYEKSDVAHTGERSAQRDTRMKKVVSEKRRKK